MNSFSPNTVIESAKVNENFDDLADGTAIQSGAITTAKIADDAVTPAKWVNPYCFRAYPSVATTVADAADTKITFGTEDYDYNNNFASSTYTVPVNGVYNFSGRVEYATSIASGVNAYTVLYVNGSPTVKGSQLGSAFVTSAGMILSTDIKLNAGDTVELWAYQDSAGTEATATASASIWFAGHLVHAI